MLRLLRHRQAHFRRSHRAVLLLWTLLCVLAMYSAIVRATGEPLAALKNNQADTLPARIDVVEGTEIRFRRLPVSAGLSQTRVAWVVQDNVGFIWLGTQYGLNRFDGYKAKVFKNEPGQPETLSCVYIRSLFVDHAGNL